MGAPRSGDFYIRNNPDGRIQRHGFQNEFGNPRPQTFNYGLDNLSEPRVYGIYIISASHDPSREILQGIIGLCDGTKKLS